MTKNGSIKIKEKDINKCESVDLESTDLTSTDILKIECRLSSPDKNINKVDPTDPGTIPKFVDKLPIPDVAQPSNCCEKNKNPKRPFYHINMREGKHKFHKDFPNATIWGYNGTYPGPTIEVEKDVPVKVKWVNELPLKHMLPLDRTLHGTMDTPEVRTVVHLHGANVAADSDGHPEAWYSRNNQYVGHKYEKEVYEYTNHQTSATMWYHDHAIGITRLNVYAGLAGFYLIRDFMEKRLNLPEGKFEIPIMIQDKQFNENGSLFYPDNATPPVEMMPVHNMDPALAVKERTMQLNETVDNYGRVIHLLNGMQWDAPATEKVKLDTMEMCHLVNNFDFAHPVHLHLVHFQVLGRRVFTEEDFDENGNYIFDLESLTPPQPYETGKKDTIAAEPGQVTSIIMHFKEHAGDYVWHCHLLEHEDNDMMRPLVVEK